MKKLGKKLLEVSNNAPKGVLQADGGQSNLSYAWVG